MRIVTQAGVGLESGPSSGSLEAVHRRVARLRERCALSPREQQILVLVASGLELKAVGPQLGCAYSSVRTHLRRMAHKLNCSTTREILICLFSENIG
jgi:DNA-binding CsgD family transcriptional regulator